MPSMDQIFRGLGTSSDQVFRGLGTASPLIGAGLGFIAGNGPGAAAGAKIGSSIGSLFNNWGTPNAGPSEQDLQLAQKKLLEQYQQQRPFQKVDFAPIEADYTSKFKNDILPGIRESLVGRGRSSGYQNALTGAGEDFATRLAAMRAQHDIGQQTAEREHFGQNLTQLQQMQNLLSGQQNYGLKFGEQQQELQRKIAEDLFEGLSGFSKLQSGNIKEGLEGAARGSGLALNSRFENLFTPAAQSIWRKVAEKSPEITIALANLLGVSVEALTGAKHVESAAKGAVQGGIEGVGNTIGNMGKGAI